MRIFSEPSNSEFQLRRLELVRHLRRQGIADPRVLAVLERVPREWFVSDASRDSAYEDRALAIECGQTISQPYLVALMTEALELPGAVRVLEIGTGSGYQTAVLSQLASEVYSIERHAELSERARAALSELGLGNVHLRVGDGALGWPAAAPFDRILVTAATSQMPTALWEQLAPNGIMVAPIGDDSSQILQAWRKRDGEPERRILCNCRFVPLISE